MRFNKKLKELRLKRGVSKSELAEGIGVSRSTVSKWEKGLALPSDEALSLLAEYFDVSSGELSFNAVAENVAVEKNRSRRFGAILASVCACVLAVIIVLALFFSGTLDNIIYGPRREIGVRGELAYCSDYSFNYDKYEWAIPESKWERIVSERNDVLSSDEIIWEKYTLTVERKYILTVCPSPGGYNGVQYGISAQFVGMKYAPDIFDIELLFDSWEVYYLLTVKQPVDGAEILLHRASVEPEDDDPRLLHRLIINAVPSDTDEE